MNILITGKNGQLGSEIKFLSKSHTQYNFLFTSVDELDITKEELVNKFFKGHQIDVLINCAAYTNVDKAEEDFENANCVNHLAVGYLAKACKEYNCRMVHVSTDYVFDGSKNKPYTEADSPNPQSIYGDTKLKGEQIMRNINPLNSIIIRTSWVYSRYGENFVNTMLRLGEKYNKINVVADQIGSPTNAADLAQAILDIIPQLNNKKVRIFHFSGEGKCSWYNFAKTIFDLKGENVKVTPIQSSEYQALAKRPVYSVLDNTLIKKTYNLNIISWEDSLEKCLEKNLFISS